MFFSSSRGRRKVKKIIPLKEEFVLREAFSREIVRKRFISDVTGIPMSEIKSVTLASNFLRRRRKKDKQGILDFVMTLNDDAKIDVELQLRKQKFWVRRVLFYLAHLYLDELFVGDNYWRLKKCITISILDFNLLDDREENHSKFTLRDSAGRELTDLFEVHVIELRKGPTGGSVDDWVRLFNATTEEELEEFEDKGEGFKEAAEAMKMVSMVKDVRWYFLQLQKAKRDRWAEDEYVRDEGRSEGRSEGFRKGETVKLIKQVQKKVRKGKPLPKIAEELETDEAEVKPLYEKILELGKDCDPEEVWRKL